MSRADDDTQGQDVPPSTFPPISQQIRAHQRRTGDSQHDISRKTALHGRRVPQRNIGDMRNGKARSWPTHENTVRALAGALETTSLAIVLGFAAELGEDVQMSEFAARLPPGVDSLDESVRESVLRLLWSLTFEASARGAAPGELPDLTAERPDGTGARSDEQDDEPGERGQQ